MDDDDKGIEELYVPSTSVPIIAEYDPSMKRSCTC